MVVCLGCFCHAEILFPALEEVICVAFQCEVLHLERWRAQNNIARYDVTLQMIFLADWAGPV